MKQEILENEQVQKFLFDNDKRVNKEMVERGLPKLYEYISQSTTCCGCDNTDYCKNYLNGFIPKLSILRGEIEIEYTRCEQKIIEDERRESANMISSMYMPKNVLRARIKDLSMENESRIQIAEMAARFVNHVRDTGELPVRCS